MPCIKVQLSLVLRREVALHDLYCRLGWASSSKKPIVLHDPPNSVFAWSSFVLGHQRMETHGVIRWMAVLFGWARHHPHWLLGPRLCLQWNSCSGLSVLPVQDCDFMQALWVYDPAFFHSGCASLYGLGYCQRPRVFPLVVALSDRKMKRKRTLELEDSQFPSLQKTGATSAQVPFLERRHFWRSWLAALLRKEENFSGNSCFPYNQPRWTRPVVCSSIVDSRRCS